MYAGILPLGGGIELVLMICALHVLLSIQYLHSAVFKLTKPVYTDDIHVAMSSETWMHRAASLFFGPSVTSFPLLSTLPTLASSSSAGRPTFLPPNSACNMRMRSSFVSGSTGASASSGSVPHGTKSREKRWLYEGGGDCVYGSSYSSIG